MIDLVLLSDVVYIYIYIYLNSDVTTEFLSYI